jgi:replicative DNA helicase
MTGKRKRAPDPVDVDVAESRVLPHNLEAEKALLGAIILDEKFLDQIAPMLQEHEFFRLAHRLLFKACLTLAYDRRVAIDPLTLRDYLAAKGELEECGGPAYIAALTDGMPRASNVAHYAGIVREKALLRGLIKTANELLAGAYDVEAGAATLLQDADRQLIDLQRRRASRLVDVRTRSSAIYEEIEYLTNHQGELSGVDTGFQSINEVTLGWQRTDLNVLAARPSIGKTAFILNSAVAAAALGKRVAIFSLEMRLKQLERRMLSQLSGVPLSRILSGYMGEDDFPRLTEAMSRLEQLAIFVDDRAGQSILDIRASCRRLRAEQGLDLVIIDYVQLMPGTLEQRGATRNEQVTDISRRTKALADEVDVPILLLSQLSRAGEKEGRRPVLSDLRESGALEQDADLVAFLHRRHHLESGTTKFIIEKQRNGPGGTLNLTINRDIQTFTDGGEDPPAPEPKAEKPKAGRPLWRRNR